MAYAADATHTPGATIAQAIPGAQRVGHGRLNWLGLGIYDASLWAAPGLTQLEFDRREFALELSYLRSLRGADIARRSIDEMRRTEGMGPAQAQRWAGQLQALFPDVAAGDRITGVHRPGRGAMFFVNGKPAGEIADAEFSRRFFGIWLAVTTSEPGLRAQLFGATPP